MFFAFLWTFSISFFNAQTTVFGYLKDPLGKPLENAKVELNDSQTFVKSDKIGYFQFVDLPPGNYSLIVSKLGYEEKTIEFEVNSKEKKKDLGTLVFSFSTENSDLGVITIEDVADFDGDSRSQPTIGLLSSGRDAFTNAAAFELGPYWFRSRGVDNRFEDVLFNGVPLSKNDDGRVDFNNWAGLNDVTRYPLENVDNIAPSAYTFGNLGGTVYYNTRASSFRKGVSLAYSFTNRSYFHRTMATYNSGLLKKGWAFSVSGSRRWADRGIIDGTYQDAYAYFISIEKKFGERHSFNFTTFGTPTYRASNSPNTQEVYDIMGKNYNSFWGWQDGEKRNSRIRNVFEPIYQLQHFWKIGKQTHFNTTFSYQKGSDARSRLDWFHASDPNPTYYRKLPSFGTYSAEEFIQRAQIDWTSLYQANFNNLENGAIYSVVEDVNKDKTINVVSHFDTKIKDFWKLNINLSYQKLESDNFRRIKDLLGAQFARNLDAFGNDQPYDVDATSIKVNEGERAQYSYIVHRNSYAVNISTEIDLQRWNIMASIFSSYTGSFREGMFRNHFYLENSKGKSEVFSSLDKGIKAKITYKINGKTFIVYQGAYFTLAPAINEIFINPRINNFFTPEIKSQLINAHDVSFITRGQILKTRLTGYYTHLKNATEISRYFAEGIQIGAQAAGSDALVAEIVSGIERRYMGIEFAADVKINATLNSVFALSYGDFTIQNNPNVYLSIDSESYAKGYEKMGSANLKGYKIAGTPQKAATIGLRYNSPKFWWAGASINYLMDQYLDFSALNRTANFYTDPATGDNYAGATPEAVASLLQQKKFDDQLMLNANAGKSFQIGPYRLGISINVNNILNNRNYVTGGFEQGRKSNFPEALEEATRPIPFFGPKLWYDRGTTFFANVYLRF